MKTNAEIVATRKRAAWFASANLSLGILAMLTSLQEGSTGWALFVWLAALQGIAIGFLAGPGWSDHLLGRTPPHRAIGATAGFAWSLLTFWAPILATLVFGLILAKTLPDAARPKSSLDGNGGVSLFQAWVMFFNAVGCTWLVVWIDTRNVIGERPLEHRDGVQEVG